MKFALPAILLAGAALTARAALIVSLDAPTVNAAAAAVITFSGTLTNDSSTARVFLNDAQCTIPAGLAVKTKAFFENVPGILRPGETYSGPIFSLALEAAMPGDYAGVLALKGGGDIFAAGELATANFLVLSPAINVAATVPGAFEFGPSAGKFTVTRTGATPIALPVAFALSGAAVNGVDFVAITSPLNIPAGASAADIAIVPRPNHLAEGDRALILTLAAAPTANLGASAAATVVVHDRPIDLWRVQQFGAAANTVPAGDTASWAGDGVANLVKYLTGANPTMNGVAALPRPALVNGYLTLSFTPNPDATDVIFSVESSSNATAWSTSEVDLLTTTPLRTYRYRHPASEGGRAYLRLKIERLP